MSGDWLDRAARAADERVSRRRLLRQAGVAALALGPLGALLRAAPARAETPCLPVCLRNSHRQANSDGAFIAKATGLTLLTPGLAGNPVIVGFIFGGLMTAVYNTVTADARCYLPNCGNPPGQPPPPPPPPGPPPAPPSSPDPFWPERQKPQRKRIKKKKPRPDPTRPCATACQCGSVTCGKGDYCGTCAATGGSICCTQPDRNGKSPCCP